MDLTELLLRPEGKTLEFKRDLSSPAGVLRTGMSGTVALDPKDAEILDTLGVADGRRTREVSDAVGLSVRATRQRLARLVELGEVREIGSGPNDPQRRYFRADG